MKISPLRCLAVSGALFALATSSAFAQTSLSGGIAQGGAITNGQTRSWAYNVPAGNYLVIGRVSYELNSEQDSVGLTCQLKRGVTSEFWDIQQASITGDAQGGHTVQGEITLLGQVPMPMNGVLAIMCQADGSGAREVHDVRLELVAVRALAELSRVDTSGPAVPQRDLRDNNLQRRRN